MTCQYKSRIALNHPGSKLSNYIFFVCFITDGHGATNIDDHMWEEIEIPVPWGIVAGN